MRTSEQTEESGRYERFGRELVSGGSVPASSSSDTSGPGRADGGPDAPAGPAGAIAGLAILGLLAWLAFASIWMFVFVVGLIVSVFLHETGHYVTARLTGMKATQFFLGFGPKLWSFQRGETEYGVRALPLGAYVRIIGMSNMDEVPPEDEGRTYRQQSYPRRMLVITAGSLMHMLIAVVLLFTVFASRGQLVDEPGAQVGQVTVSGPAAEAGVLDGDVIAAIDGRTVAGPEDLGTTVRSFQPGDGVDVTVRRDGVEQSIRVGLGANPDEQSPLFGQAFLGVSSRPVAEWQEMSIGSAAASSVTELFPTAWESTKGIIQVLNPVNIVDHLSGDSQDLTTRPTTVVGITQVTDTIGESEGLIGVLYVLAALNVFVGVFNMFPLLPLDGGHAAVATYERLRERNGRRYFADVSKLMPLAMGVIVVL
ncbi:MAG: M50 family metallopeptidase, partial [Ilumatobacteraceae bacterium]